VEGGSIRCRSQFKVHHGFNRRTSLIEFRMPSLIDIINFWIQDKGVTAAGPATISFAADSHFPAVSGLTRCTTLDKIEFPRSFEKISGFDVPIRLNLAATASGLRKSFVH
jgi:hypothetical protein